MTKEMQNLALAPVGNPNLISGRRTRGRCYRLTRSGHWLKGCITGGDLEAAKTLILSHLRFVVHIARNYAGYGLPQADLIQKATSA